MTGLSLRASLCANQTPQIQPNPGAWFPLVRPGGRRDELRRYRADLQEMGHEVTSSWLDTEFEETQRPPGVPSAAPPEERALHAHRDLEDLASAVLCISFTEPTKSKASRGGRHVEMGVALGKGLECWVVGPRENVFHYLENIRNYASWESALRGLRALQAKEASR